MMDGKKYKGLPVFWESKNMVIVYDQFAVHNKYKLYQNGRYLYTEDSFGKLYDYAKTMERYYGRITGKN